MLSLCDIAPSQALHKKQLPAEIPSLLERMSQELTCSICLDLFNGPMITHCGHIFCSDCIMRAVSSKPACPLCKSTCSKRMVRPWTCTGTLMESFRRLYDSVDSLEQTPPKRGKKRQSVGKSVVKSVAKGLPTPSALRVNYAPSISPAGSEDVEYLRDVNSRILSEIGRIDDRIEAIKKTEGGDAPTQMASFSTQTQKFLDEIEFPSSPVLSPFANNSVYLSDIFEPSQSQRDMVVIATTMLNKEEQSQVKKWASQVGAIYCSDYNGAVTHLIARTSEENDRLAVRSMKTMQAIVHGRWILPFAWVEAGLRASTIPKEEPFELEGDQFSEDESPRRSRMSHRNGEPLLFQGFKFYLFGSFSNPSQQELSDLLIAAGGEIIPDTIELASHVKGHDGQVLVLGDPAAQDNWEKDQGIIEKFPFLQTTWVYASISAFEPADYRHFYFL